MKEGTCYFSSFFNGPSIPYYIIYYIKELALYYDRIIFVTNKKSLDAPSLDALQLCNSILFEVDNEGYDFGMWYKSLKAFPPRNREEIALVNDSCILFTTLHDTMQRLRNSHAQYSGLVISDRYARHIQSYFLVISPDAVPAVLNYFERKGIVTAYRDVIQIYEIGLSQEMIRLGFTVQGLYNNDQPGYPKNPSFARIDEFLKAGMPMIKKKIVFRNYRGLEYYWVVRMGFHPDYRKYTRWIESHYPSAQRIDFARVMNDAPHRHHFDIYMLQCAAFVANLAKKIPGMPFLFHTIIGWIKKWKR